MHAPDHVIVSDQGPVAIQWKGSGRGPRLADFAYLMRGTWLNPEWIDAAVGAYRQHIELTDGVLNRLEAVMYVRPLHLPALTGAAPSRAVASQAAATVGGTNPTRSTSPKQRPNPSRIPLIWSQGTDETRNG